MRYSELKDMLTEADEGTYLYVTPKRATTAMDLPMVLIKVGNRWLYTNPSPQGLKGAFSASGIATAIGELGDNYAWSLS